MLEFEFNGHKSSEFGVIISRVEENDNLISRSPILGQKISIDLVKIILA